MTTKSEKVLNLVDTMIANKITFEGEIYYRAKDVMQITDVLHDIAQDNLNAIKRVAN